MEDKNVNMQEDTENVVQASDVSSAESSLSAEEILTAIKELVAENDCLCRSIDALEHMPPADGPGDIAGAEKAKAIADVVRCRETTNQRALDIYEKMYDDLTKDRERTKYEMLRIMVNQAVEIVSEEGRGELLTAMAKMYTEN